MPVVMVGIPVVDEDAGGSGCGKQHDLMELRVEILEQYMHQLFANYTDHVKAKAVWGCCQQNVDPSRWNLLAKITGWTPPREDHSALPEVSNGTSFVGVNPAPNGVVEPENNRGSVAEIDTNELRSNQTPVSLETQLSPPSSPAEFQNDPSSTESHASDSTIVPSSDSSMDGSSTAGISGVLEDEEADEEANKDDSLVGDDVTLRNLQEVAQTSPTIQGPSYRSGNAHIKIVRPPMTTGDSGLLSVINGNVQSPPKDLCNKSPMNCGIDRVGLANRNQASKSRKLSRGTSAKQKRRKIDPSEVFSPEASVDDEATFNAALYPVVVLNTQSQCDPAEIEVVDLLDSDDESPLSTERGRDVSKENTTATPQSTTAIHDRGQPVRSILQSVLEQGKDKQSAGQTSMEVVSTNEISASGRDARLESALAGEETIPSTSGASDKDTRPAYDAPYASEEDEIEPELPGAIVLLEQNAVAAANAIFTGPVVQQEGPAVTAAEPTISALQSEAQVPSTAGQPEVLIPPTPSVPEEILPTPPLEKEPEPPTQLTPPSSKSPRLRDMVVPLRGVQKRLRCTKCQKRFESVDLLDKHTVNDHTHSGEEMESADEAPKSSLKARQRKRKKSYRARDSHAFKNRARIDSDTDEESPSSNLEKMLQVPKRIITKQNFIMCPYCFSSVNRKYRIDHLRMKCSVVTPEQLELERQRKTMSTQWSDYSEKLATKMKESRNQSAPSQDTHPSDEEPLAAKLMRKSMKKLDPPLGSGPQPSTSSSATTEPGNQAEPLVDAASSEDEQVSNEWQEDTLMLSEGDLEATRIFTGSEVLSTSETSVDTPKTSKRHYKLSRAQCEKCGKTVSKKYLQQHYQSRYCKRKLDGGMDSQTEADVSQDEQETESTQKVQATCWFCGKKLLPVSLRAHIRKNCEAARRVREAPEFQTEEEQSEEENTPPPLLSPPVRHLPTVNYDETSDIEDLPEGDLLEEEEDGTEGDYMCPYEDCGFEPKTLREMEKHEKLHPPERGYRCDKPGCDKVFFMELNKNEHFRNHTRIYPHDVTGISIRKDPSLQPIVMMERLKT